MGNVGIALGGGRAFAAPAWLMLIVIVLAIVGARKLTKNK